MQPNQFFIKDIAPGKAGVVDINGESVAVFNVDGKYFALDDYCPHAGAPLSEGSLDGTTVICPWHGSCFDLNTGERTCGPAREGVRTYKITIQGDIGQVE
jgi:nitrite reductase/ring-hydroxylating ferredoxin subunit